MKIAKIKEVLSDTKIPKYAFDQIALAIYKQGVTDFNEITTISKDLRSKIIERLETSSTSSLKKISEQQSKQSQKILFQLNSGEKIETVRMLFKPDGKSFESACISSQSGCGLGCSFCATGMIGFKQNLTGEEISDQILYFTSQGHNIHSISFMGMGEPLANADNVIDAINILTNKKYFGISPRHISVSTVGIIPGLKKLSETHPQVNITYSLHSPYPRQREEIMKVEKAFPATDVLTVLDEHINKTNRRVFLGYLLLGDVNDSQKHANDLVKLIRSRGKNCYLYHVNLIKYHPCPSLIKYVKPSDEAVKSFEKVLKINNISYSVRQSFGEDIFAACGQLYGEYTTRN